VQDIAQKIAFRRFLGSCLFLRCGHFLYLQWWLT